MVFVNTIKQTVTTNAVEIKKSTYFLTAKYELLIRLSFISFFSTFKEKTAS